MEFKHKLAKASFDFVLSENKYPLSACGYLQEVFESGAEWLQSQPLADRLTEEERKKIKKLYAIIESMFDMLPEGHVNQRRVIKAENMLIDIFGREMFEK